MLRRCRRLLILGDLNGGTAIPSQTNFAPEMTDESKAKKAEEFLKSKLAMSYPERLRDDYNVKVVKRIHTAIDSTSMCAVDNERVISRAQCKDVMLMNFLMPIIPIQGRMHARWEMDTIAQHPAMGPCGIMTLCVSRTKTQNKRWLDRLTEPREGNIAMNLRFLVADRLHWERTLWNFRTYTKSLGVGWMMRKTNGLDIDDSSKVDLQVDYDNESQKYRQYNVKIPNHKVSLDVEDTGVPLLSADAKITPGFANNESALRVLAMSSDSHGRGVGGQVYRLPAWSTPAIPTLGRVRGMEGLKEFLTEEIGVPPLGDATPFSTWLVRDIPEIRYYPAEMGVEAENEPNITALSPAPDYTERAHTKALNRQRRFMAELRAKSQAESEGRDIPR